MVQVQKVTLQIYAVPEVSVRANDGRGFIRLTVPKGVVWNKDGVTCYDVMLKKSCHVLVGPSTFTIFLSADLIANKQFQYQILGAIDNPDSEQPTDSFKLDTSEGEQQSSGLSISATRGGMSMLTLTPKSTVVGDSTQLEVRWKAQHTLPKGGVVILTFPVWNLNQVDPNLRKSYIQGKEECSLIGNQPLPVKCVYKSSQLTVSEISTTSISGGVEMAFSVTAFKNPIDTSLYQGFKLQTAVESKTGIFVIDEAIASLYVSDYATLPQGRLIVKDPTAVGAGIIQHDDTMVLEFYLPVPLNKGCMVTVQLPQQYSVNTIKEVYTMQAFGAYKARSAQSGTLTIDQAKNSFVVKACDDYIENQTPAQIEIVSLKQFNYEAPTDSVQIQIQTASQNGIQYKVAKADQGITFTPQRGKLELQAVAENSVVQEPTKISFTLKPEHTVYIVDDPQITIEFPPEVQISSVQCSITQVQINDQSVSVPVQCSRFQQTLTIKSFLLTDYVPSSTSSIKFTIAQVTNPISNAKINGLKVTMVAKGQYAIDMFQGLAWQITLGTFSAATVTTSSTVAYTKDVAYTVSFTPQHSIPLNGYFEIVIPDQVSIPDPSFTQSSCQVDQTSAFGSAQIACQFVTPRKLRVTSGFRRQAGPAKVEYRLVLQGMQNPESTLVTDSFTFASFSSSGDSIDILMSGVTIKMTQNAKLQTVQVSLGSYDNSAITNYTFTMVPSIPIHASNGDMILVTFPTQIKLPTANLTCTSPLSPIITAVKCWYDPTVKTPNTIRVDLILKEPGISPQDRFSFSINGIQNSQTLKTPDSIQVNIVNSSYVTLNSMTDGILVTTNNAWIVNRSEIAASSINPGRASDFTIEFHAEHSIQQGGGILIVYPPQITPMNETLTVSVTIPGLTVNPEALTIQQDVSARAVLIWNIIQATTYVPQAGKPIKVVLKGLRNPFTNAPSDSFAVQTFDTYSEKGLLNFYFIDKKTTGMVVRSKCNYPCKDCNPDNADVCTECYPDSETPFLQLGSCVKQCATSRFFNEVTQQCDQCDAACLQCSGTANTCTKCGVSDLLYLEPTSNMCLKECPIGTLEDGSQNLCIPCNQNCRSCEKKLDTCTSCDQSGQWPYLFHDACVQRCEPLVSVLVEGVCVECHSSCATCAGSPQFCTSCVGLMKFDLAKGTCSNMCEPEKTIFTPSTEDPTQSGSCEPCNETCLKCAGTVDKCTVCKPGFVLNLDLQCKPTCNKPDGTIATDQTAIDGVCYQCEKPCATCGSQINVCTSCLDNWLNFKASTCVQYCPEKWVANEDNTMCIWEGLSCPENFDINKTGDGCVPKVFDCKPGYTINPDRTACIPKPGSPVPFPFILAAIIMSLLVFGSYIKDKFTTKVITNLVSLIGTLEGLMYGLMIIFAYTQQQWLIMFLSLAGLIGLCASNMIWVFWYRQRIYNVDEEFKKWLFFFPSTKRALPLCCLLLNFKCSKMLYSGFYGLESTMAKFGNQPEFFQVMRSATYFSWIFCYGPIFAADIVILTKIKWGYQLLILAVETIILQTMSIVLTQMEFRQGFKKLLNPIGEHYAQFKKGKEMRVMAFDQESDYEEGILDVDDETFIRSRAKVEDHETELRRKAFVKILHQVGVSLQPVHEREHRPEREENLSCCVTKFNEKDLRFRRAFSMSNHSDNSWVAEGDEDPKEMTRIDDSREERPIRRYSFPLSPRTFAEIPERTLFEKQVDDIKNAADAYLIDNVYTDVATHPKKRPKLKVKTVSRRTQTFLRELLQVEAEEMNNSQMEVLLEDEAEIEYDFTKNLIGNVLDGVSDHSTEHHRPSTEMQPPTDLKRRVFKAKKQIPDFELQDIMGEFEIDDLGNYIIMRGERGELLDKRDRLVNRRGYLIDRFGNVINNQGTIIFKVVELDIDDEIPAPFGFEKRKKNIIKLGEENKFMIQAMPQQHVDVEPLEVVDEDKLDQEVRGIRDKSQPSERSAKDLKALRDRSQQSDGATIRAEVRQGGGTIMTLDELEQMGSADEAGDSDGKSPGGLPTSKKKKRSKGRKKKKAAAKQLNNLPPKRITQADVNSIFPQIGVENEEQRKLARIAGTISDMTSMLAQNVRLQNMANIQDEIRRNQFDQDRSSDGIVPRSEYLNDSEFDCVTDQRKSRLQDRPNTVNLIPGLRKNMTLDKSSSQTLKRPKSKQALRGNDLQRVYGNIVDMTSLEDQDYPRGDPRGKTVQQPSRVGSGKIGKDLESIYLQDKYRPTSKAPLKKDADPFRPTLGRFADDPSELNVDTQMKGERQGKDVSLAIVDNLDKMQREYLTSGTSNLRQQMSNSQLLPRPDPMSRMVAQSMKNSNHMDPVNRNNWVDRENNI